MSPLLRKNDIIRLYPKKLNYLFLAVFAFSEAFCYAKTAFSYSPDILPPCTPVLFMVKDVVKSECRMIDMWSCFQVVEALEIASSLKKRMESREETYRSLHVVKLIPRDDKHVVREYKHPRAEN